MNLLEELQFLDEMIAKSPLSRKEHARAMHAMEAIGPALQLKPEPTAPPGPQMPPDAP